MKRFLFLIGVLLIFSFPASAQFVIFRIPVKDAETKQAINAKAKAYLVTDTDDVYLTNYWCYEANGGIIEQRIVETCNNIFKLEIVGSKLIEVKEGEWKLVGTDEYEPQSVFIQRKDDMKFPYTLPTVYLKKRVKDQ